MAPRRDKTPPYEIMRSVTRGGQGASARPSPRSSQSRHDDKPESAAEHAERGTGEAAMGSHAAGASPWSWSGVGVPVTLRVPRGAVILAVVGLVGLLALAYWAGHMRGSAAADAMQAELLDSSGAGSRAAPGSPPAESPGGDAPADAAPGSAAGTGAGPDADADAGPPRLDLTFFTGTGSSVEAGSADDPRQSGLNYMIVAHYPPQYVPDLVEFLSDLGVETVVQPVNNGRLVRVWVTNRGFTREEYGGEEYHAYAAELREIGRAWRRHRPDLRDSFVELHPRRYD